MNDNRVVTVEKKGANIIGLILLLILVFGGLGLTAYYFISDKELPFIEKYLPWHKDSKENGNEEEDFNEINNNSSSKSNRKEYTVTREKVEFTKDQEIYSSKNLIINLVNYEFKDNSYTFKLRLHYVTEDLTLPPLTVKIKEVTVNGYQFDIKSNLQVGPGSETSYDLELTKEELDKNRIGSISKILLISDITISGDTTEERIGINSVDGESIDNVKTISKIETINKEVDIYYYKRTDSSNSTKVYFLVDNRSGSNYKYSINRLIVNNKDVDVSKYEATIYGSSKYLSIVDVPKNLFNQNTQINISFILENEDHSIFKTVGKQLNL